MADIFEIVGRVSLDGVDKTEKELRGIAGTGEQTSSKLSKLITPLENNCSNPFPNAFLLDSISLYNLLG